jgi:Holliday junction resolvasome RuvABC endonuclease subunit
MEKDWRYLIVIDPSPNCTGWAVFDLKDKPKLLTYGHVYNRHYEVAEFGKKLAHIEAVLNVLKFNFYPHNVIKEEWVNSPGSGYKTAMPHGLVEKVFSHIMPIQEYNNTNFKREFTGNGRAKKDEVEAEVLKYKTKIWGRKPLVFATDDESDSVGIGIHWLVQNDYLPKL